MGNHSNDALRSLLTTYNELNSSQVEELQEEPSALDFMRYVAKSRPFVIRGGCNDWRACSRWSSRYLAEVLHDSSVQVAITPFGNADSVIECADGSLLFVKPLEVQEPFPDVLNYICKQANDASSDPVKYAQTQNDNLRSEYKVLFSDVPQDISWASLALQKEPDAVNFWLGNSRSVTALHRDNYENLYAQIRGQKHFVLLPPMAAPCINEQWLPSATYQWSDVGKTIPEKTDGRLGSLKPVVDDPPATIPFPTWDPDRPDRAATSLSQFTEPLNVTLYEGDLLYLPAMWYHKVSQSCGEEGFSCAVNYWYDMDYDGPSWVTNTFIRDLALGTT